MFVNEKGFSLLTTLFILVLLALIASSLFRIVFLSQGLSYYHLLRIRANAAALSGLEIVKAQLLTPSWQCQDQKIFFDEKEQALSGFQVNIACEQYHYFIDQKKFYDLVITANAVKGDFGQRDYVSQTQHYHVLQIKEPIEQAD